MLEFILGSLWTMIGIATYMEVLKESSIPERKLVLNLMLILLCGPGVWVGSIIFLFDEVYTRIKK